MPRATRGRTGGKRGPGRGSPGSAVPLGMLAWVAGGLSLLVMAGMVVLVSGAADRMARSSAEVAAVGQIEAALAYRARYAKAAAVAAAAADGEGFDHTSGGAHVLPEALAAAQAAPVGTQGVGLRFFGSQPVSWRAPVGSAEDKAFDDAALAWLAQNQGPYSVVDTVGGRTVLRYAVADPTLPSCGSCHVGQSKEPGGNAVAVTVPLASLAKAARKQLLGAVGLVLLGAASLCGLVLYVVGRAKACEDHAGRVEEEVSDVKRRLLSAMDQATTARARATEATLTRSVFLSNMSHDLRTPLNAIIGYSEMLQEEAEEAGLEDYVDDLGRIHGAGKQLLAMINSVLNVSKIEAGSVELYLEDFAVQAVVKDAAHQVRSALEEKNNDLEAVIPDDIGEMHADRTRLGQALANLFLHANLRQSGEPVTVEVRRVDEEGADWILFEVFDRGGELSPEEMSHLFKVFSPENDGSGMRKGPKMDLAIGRQFVRIMGGDITARNANSGIGAVLILRVPAVVNR